MIVYKISVPDEIAKMIYMDSICVSCSDSRYTKLQYVLI